jgi:hypothetical protein
MMWLTTGIPLGIGFGLWRTWNDNIVLKFIGVCAGFLAGVVLGPCMLLLIAETRSRDLALKNSETEQ